MRNIFSLAILVVIINLLSCEPDREFETKYLNNPTTAKIDILAQRYLELERFSGVILITKGDTIIYNNSFGLADYESNIAFSDKTSFKIGKISEVITANIIRKMVEKDAIKLSDKINQYIPEIIAEFTIKDLMEHKTSLPALATVIEQNPDIPYSTIKFTNLAIKSSDTAQYSELNYNLLGVLIERQSGKTFQENLQDYSENLGLVNTYFQRLDTALAEGYLHYNHRGKGLELLKSPIYDANIAFSSNGIKSTAIDLVKIVNSNPNRIENKFSYTSDDGFSYSLTNIPLNQTTIIILSNRRHPVAQEIANSIDSILQNKSYRIPLPRKPLAIDKSLLDDFTGTYSLNEQVNFEVITENDSLFVVMGSNRIHLIPQSSNQFYMEQNDAAQRFIRDSTNTVIGVELLDGFLDGEIAKKMEE